MSQDLKCELVKQEDNGKILIASPVHLSYLKPESKAGRKRTYKILTTLTSKDTYTLGKAQGHAWYVKLFLGEHH